jgi:hypothetical protein
MQSLEIQIAPIQDVKSAWFRDQHVEDIHLVPLAVRDMDEARDVAAQIQQHMHFHRGFGRTKRRPWEYRQARVDGRDIQRIDGFGQVDTKRLVDVELACHAYQALGEVRIDAPVPYRIGVCQRIARYRAAKTHVVELGRLAAQAGFDVAQALPVSQLREGHAQELVRAGELLDLVFPAVAGDAAAEGGKVSAEGLDGFQSSHHVE